MVDGLEVSELTSLADLESLRPEWRDLWRRCPTATPFQSPAWLIPWWRQFGGSELAALAVRADGKLIGLAPFFIWHDPPLRKVVPVGAGITDYLDVLFAPGTEQDGATAVFAHLEETPRRWDVIWSPDLRQDSVLFSCDCPAGWGDAKTASELCPVLQLPQGVDQLPEAVPDGKFRKLRYYRRRIAKLGGLTVERADSETLATLFDGLVALHTAEWEAKGQPGMLAEPAVLAFHREVVAAMLADGMLRLNGFRFEGRLVASLYAFAGHHRVYAYLGAYDPSLAQLGLGTVSVGTAIEEAADEGALEFDFLRGREQHKYSWGANDVPTFSRTLTPRRAVAPSN